MAESTSDGFHPGPALPRRLPTLGTASWPTLAWWAGVAAYAVHRLVVRPLSVDLAVYRATAGQLWHGASIYAALPLFDHLLATYPPIAAVLFLPLWWVPFGVLQLVVAACNVAAVLVVTSLAARVLRIAPERRRSWALVAGGVALVSEPVTAVLDLGQIELALAALVLLDLGRPAGARLRGAGIGLATAIKLTPGIFILHLAVTGRRREAGVAAATTLLTTSVGWLILPTDSLRYWRRLVFETGRVGLVWRPDNQSLQGVVARAVGRPDAPRLVVVVSGVVLIAGLLLARQAWVRLGEGWALTVTAVTGLLISPISWTDHWIWCVPIAMVLAQTSPPLLALVAVFWTFAVRLPPNPYHHVVALTAPMQVLSDSYVLAGLAVLVIAASLVLNRGRVGRLRSTPVEVPAVVEHPLPSSEHPLSSWRGSRRLR